MAHFAKLNHLGIVVDVVVVNDTCLIDDNGQESEQKGIEWLIEWSNGYQYWAKTSYNTLKGEHRNGGVPFRLNYAYIGGTYDKVRDAFIEWRPNNEDLILDEQRGIWVRPDYENRPQHDWDQADYPQPTIDRDSVWDWDPVNWTWVSVPRNS